MIDQRPRVIERAAALDPEALEELTMARLEAGTGLVWLVVRKVPGSSTGGPEGWVPATVTSHAPNFCVDTPRDSWAVACLSSSARDVLFDPPFVSADFHGPFIVDLQTGRSAPVHGTHSGLRLGRRTP